MTDQLISAFVDVWQVAALTIIIWGIYKAVINFSIFIDTIKSNLKGE